MQLRPPGDSASRGPGAGLPAVDLDAGRLLTLLRYTDIIREPLPEVPWQIRPLFAQGDRVLIFGEFGTFKTILGLDMAIHLAHGQEWLGHTVTRPYNVLYVDEEMNQHELRRRVKRLGPEPPHHESDTEPAEVSEHPPSEPLTSHLSLLSRHGIRMSPQGAQKLLHFVEPLTRLPEVIFLDSLGRLLLGDENLAPEVAEFFRRLEPISSRGITCIIMDHMNKPSQDRPQLRYRSRGSMRKLEEVDAAFALERDKYDRSRIKVTCVKERSGCEPPPFSVTLRDAGDRLILARGVAPAAPEPLFPDAPLPDATPPGPAPRGRMSP